MGLLARLNDLLEDWDRFSELTQVFEHHSKVEHGIYRARVITTVELFVLLDHAHEDTLCLFRVAIQLVK